MMRLRAGVAIDLGTVNTLVSIRGRGLVIEEPSAIAVHRGTGQTVAVGRAADALAGKAPQGVDIVHPLRDGVIADLEAATAMLQTFLREARLRRGLLRPVAVVCVPSGATWSGLSPCGSGGNAMDEAIVAAVKAELGLLIGRNAARRLKMDLGLTPGTPEWAVANRVAGDGVQPRQQHFWGGAPVPMP